MAGNPEHRERTDSLGKDWEHAGNKTGNPGNIFISHDPPIPPFEPVPLTLPVPHPALRPQTSRGTNLVRLRPLRLRLVDASSAGPPKSPCSVCSPAKAQSPLPTDRLRNALPADRWPVAPNLACQATRGNPIRIWLWLPPTTGRGHSPRPSTSIRPQTTGQKRRPPVSSRR